MDKREALRSMLNNLIQDRESEASVDFHNYITSKMRDISGLSSQAPTAEPAVVADEDDDFQEVPE
jgi:hypothetical protein